MDKPAPKRVREWEPLEPACWPCREPRGTCFPGPCKLYVARSKIAVPPCDDAEVMRIWRECGLPEYFLGNGGTNRKLVEFARRCRATLANAEPSKKD